MATYYVDGVSGLDANAGTSFPTAWLTIGKLFSTIADGDTGIICNTGTYTLTSTVTASIVGTAANGGVKIVGADASGNLITASGTGPLITSATNSVALITLTAAAYWRFKFLRLTHTAGTRGDGFQCLTTAPGNIFIEGVSIDGCLNGFNGGSRDAGGLMISDSYIANSIGAGIINGSTAAGALIGNILRDTTIYNNGTHGFSTNGNTATLEVERCIIAKNGGKGLYDTGTSRDVRLVIHDSTIADNVSDGIRSDESTGTFKLIGSRNIIWGNLGVGVDILTQTTVNSDARCSWRGNFYGSNSSGDLFHLSAGAGDVIGIADPFTSRAGKDWSLNTATNGGGLIRALGFPGLFRGTSTTGYPDGGAAQHPDPVGGGVAYFPVTRNFIEEIEV